MKKSALHKKNRRTIRDSLGRFFAILAIVGLGVGFFAGLKSCKQAMLTTGNAYVQELKLFDFRLLSTLGFTEEDVEAFSRLPGVSRAAGSFSCDVEIRTADRESVLHALLLTDGVNGVQLRAGRMPEKGDEVIGDARFFSADRIGEVLTVEEENLRYKNYTLVGVADSVLYLNYERGTTSRGSGSVAGFLCLTRDGFSDSFTEIYTEMYLKLSDDAFLYSDAYQTLVDSAEPSVTALLTERGTLRYESLAEEADEKLADARQELADGETTYADKEAEAQQGFADAEKELADAEEKLFDAKKQLTDAKKELDDGWNALYDARQEWFDNRVALNRSDSELKKNEAAFQAAKDAIAAAMGLPAGSDVPLTPELQAMEKLLTEARKTVDSSYALLDAADEEIEKNAVTLKEAQDEYDRGAQEYRKNLADFETAKNDYQTQRADAEKELADARQELDDAKAALADGEEERAKLKEPTTYVLGRDTNVGHVCFENDASIVEGVSRVFPVFFFLVAALVCAATMTRMVEDDRTRTGLLKALGYSKSAIISGYTTYSGSAALLGAAAGFFLGTKLMPMVIWKVYEIMYSIHRPITYIFSVPLAFIAAAAALLCSVGTTWLCCRAQLAEKPAGLLRPKAPAAGKRILLERIRPLWKHMGFLAKVSARNIFRDKKRMGAMILGVGGCTALLITGFGIRDSIGNIASDQFGGIMLYDAAVTFDEPISSSLSMGEKSLAVYSGGIDVVGEKTKNATLISAAENVDGFVNLHDGSTPLAYPKAGEVILTKKLAETVGVSVGDVLTLRDEDGKSVQVRLIATADNYFYNYAYICDETYTQGFGEPLKKTAFVVLNASDDPYTAAAGWMQNDDVVNVSLSAELKSRVSSMLKSLDYIVLMVLVCAAALAFVVLYNLININIIERKREIATLKVLGFHRGETAAYVFRENIVLTALGALCGIPMGLWLHRFVMSCIRIDMVTFRVHVAPQTYAYAMVLTFVFAIAVDLFMRRKLTAVDMADSLKSVE